jgi:tetratricopeptide (TPR) repeat protein
VTFRPGAPPPLPHLAYLEALAQCTEEGARWHSVTAGYAVLQLFEGWAGHDGSGVPPSVLELRRVRKRLAAVAEFDPIRRCLTQLVDVIERATVGAQDPVLLGIEVGRILAAYGKLLQYEASWSLSRDVFETVVAYAQCIDDEERLLDSMLQVGFSLRMLAQFDDARDAYGRLRDTAALLESEQYLLLSELGFAKIAIERGNLPAAAGMLDQIITEAREVEHVGIRAKALMDRARVAHQLGDLATATILGHQALESSTDPMERERILINLGVTLTQLGMLNEARDAYLVVSASAQELTTRWLAEINLMELAYLEARELTFEQYRRQLADKELPPYLQAVYQETLAHGWRVFGREEAAREAFERMRAVGERYGLNEFVIKADAALEDVMRAAPAVIPPAIVDAGEHEAGIAAVVHSLSELRSNILRRD